MKKNDITKKKNCISSKNKADYNIKWETIYADSEITDDEINEFKEILEKDNYKVANVLKGKK